MARPRHRVSDLRPEEIEDPGKRFPEGADAEPGEHQGGQRAAPLTGHQYFRAGGAFRVGKHAVLLHDQRAPERHHHQDAENAAGKRQHRDLQVVEITWSERHKRNQRRNREDDAPCKRLARGADRLDDVVLENCRADEPLEHGNGEYRDRNRRADGQPGPQAEVDGGCAEEQTEEDAEDDRFDGEFCLRFNRGDERLLGLVAPTACGGVVPCAMARDGSI